MCNVLCNSPSHLFCPWLNDFNFFTGEMIREDHKMKNSSYTLKREKSAEDLMVLVSLLKNPPFSKISGINPKKPKTLFLYPSFLLCILWDAIWCDTPVDIK